VSRSPTSKWPGCKMHRWPMSLTDDPSHIHVRVIYEDSTHITHSSVQITHVPHASELDAKTRVTDNPCLTLMIQVIDDMSRTTLSDSDDPCPTYEWVMCLTHRHYRWWSKSQSIRLAWLMSHIWLSHGTHMNESWQKGEWVVSHAHRCYRRWSKSQSIRLVYHIWLSHGMNESWPKMNESCLTHTGATADDASHRVSDARSRHVALLPGLFCVQRRLFCVNIGLFCVGIATPDRVSCYYLQVPFV